MTETTKRIEALERENKRLRIELDKQGRAVSLTHKAFGAWMEVIEEKLISLKGEMNHV